MRFTDNAACLRGLRWRREVRDFRDDTPLLHRSGWQKNLPTDWEIR